MGGGVQEAVMVAAAMAAVAMVLEVQNRPPELVAVVVAGKEPVPRVEEVVPGAVMVAVTVEVAMVEESMAVEPEEAQVAVMMVEV